jgi:putative transposase
VNHYRHDHALTDMSGRTPTDTPGSTPTGLYKTECVRHDGPFRTVDDLELATLSWVHWFNTNRLHSALDDYATPLEFENAYYRQINPQQQPLPGEPALH